MLVTDEEWKDIPGYEGLYQVSNFGEVKSLNWKRTGREQILKLSICKRHVGMDCERYYHKVDLWKDGKRNTYHVHRLVAQAFIPNPDKLPEVDHIICKQGCPENGLDNRVENLKWSTKQQNRRNRTKPTKGYSRGGNGWKVQLQHPETRKMVYIKYCHTEEEAKKYVEATKIVWKALYPECH